MADKQRPRTLKANINQVAHRGEIAVERIEVDHTLPDEVIEGLVRQRLGSNYNDCYQTGINPVTENLQFTYGRCMECKQITTAGATWSYKGIELHFFCFNHTNVPTWDKSWKLPQLDKFFPAEGANLHMMAAMLKADDAVTDLKLKDSDTKSKGTSKSPETGDTT